MFLFQRTHRYCLSYVIGFKHYFNALWFKQFKLLEARMSSEVALHTVELQYKIDQLERRLSDKDAQVSSLQYQLDEQVYNTINHRLTL